MSILTFDEKSLTRQLDALPKNLRTVFAAACAHRQLPNYIRFATSTRKGNAAMASEALAMIWNELEHQSLTEKALQDMHDRCLLLIPDCDEYYFEGQEYATDAVTALACAIQTLQSGNSKEALWAAEHAYEALFQYLIRKLNLDPSSRADLLRFDAHDLVQTELARQRTDMAELHAAAKDESQEKRVISQIKHRAERDSAVFFG